jgi:hypothetical protein
MKLKIYFFLVIAGFYTANAQTPELLYYKFEGTATNIPNLATNPPTGTQTAEIVGNLTLGSSTLCLANGLVGSGSTAVGNYLNTKWNLSLSGSWTMHFKLNNFVNDNTVVYYLMGDGITGGASFRMFTNGGAGANNIRISANGITNINVNGVFPAANPVDIIILYDSTLQQVRTYVNGVLNTTTAQGSPIALNGTTLKIGGYASTGITGMKAGMIIDEFGLFNRAITATEIASLNDFCSSLSTEDNVIKDDNSRIYTENGNLILEKGKFGKYEIYDYSGRTLMSGNQSSNSIDISILKKGVYIIKYGENTARFKL